MATLTTLGPRELRRAVESFRDALRDHQEELNRLNVYPVPDGDTGTNMALTLEAVCKELANAEAMPEVCTAISRGSLMGARGNSGVITSQILRGITEVVASRASVDADALVGAFRRGADAAYEAVLRPVEGTILTVVRETAEALEATAAGSPRDPGASVDLVTLLEAAHAAALAAVARTPELLPALRDAGVVDSGGRGFTLFVAALLHVVDGRPLPVSESGATPAVVERHLAGDDIAGLRYEVMFLLDSSDDAIGMFRGAWASIGDSIVIVGGDGLWNCHVHTNDIGAAIEAGIEAGRPHEVRVTDLFDEVAAGEREWVIEAAAIAGVAPRPEVETAVVAVAVGDGVQRLLSALGVQQIVAGGQSMNPSTAQILEAVDGCNAPSVVVLPNNKNIVPVAQQVPLLSDKRVEVVPTTSIIEALAALVNYDPDAPISDNVAALSEASLRVRSGEVTQAVRDSHGACGPINQGDWIAIERGGGIVAALGSAADACAALLDRLVDDDSEIVTVVVGSDARPADNARIEAHLKLAHPHVESEFHEGGQPLYPYLVGVE